MIVTDASFLSNAVGDDEAAGEAARAILDHHAEVSVPHLADVEVLSTLRKRALAGTMTTQRCVEALRDLTALPYRRYPAAAFLERAFELRHTVSAYDAIYVALAEALGCELVTADGRLARAPGLRCAVRLIRA